MSRSKEALPTPPPLLPHLIIGRIFLSRRGDFLYFYLPQDWEKHPEPPGYCRECQRACQVGHHCHHYRHDRRHHHHQGNLLDDSRSTSSSCSCSSSPSPSIPLLLFYFRIGCFRCRIQNSELMQTLVVSDMQPLARQLAWSQLSSQR